MPYLVKARVKSGCARALAKAIADRTIGRGSIAGDEEKLASSGESFLQKMTGTL
jgi:hypothetical protein